MKKDLILVLYGSTGDLSFRKLLPAIVSLKEKEILPEKTIVLALGRRTFDTNEYLEFVKSNNPSLNIDVLKDLVHYHEIQITEEDEYPKLLNLINEYRFKTSRIIHYLSVAPELMLTVANSISQYDVVKKDDLYSSIIFEKPFGVDYHSSRYLNKKLWTLFDEKQIYRIDHYLGKKMLTDLIDIRFKSAIFAPILKTSNVKHIDLIVKEEVGIMNRGAFYESTGASKDMFQSHILQMISLVLMDRPKTFDSKAIINQKVKVIKQLKLDEKSLVFGQYNGYLNEDNVASNSLTETLLSLNMKYKNTTISVLTGKKMNSKETYINYVLNDCSTLRVSIYPELSLTINSKFNSENIVFKHEFSSELDEYAMLLYSAINNQKEMFVRWDEIEESWKFVDNLVSKKKELLIYNKDLK